MVMSQEVCYEDAGASSLRPVKTTLALSSEIKMMSKVKSTQISKHAAVDKVTQATKSNYCKSKRVGDYLQPVLNHGMKAERNVLSTHTLQTSTNL